MDFMLTVNHAESKHGEEDVITSVGYAGNAHPALLIIDGKAVSVEVRYAPDHSGSGYANIGEGWQRGDS